MRFFAGVAARDGAGPAVILSYMLAAFASFLAALCYTEFAVEARARSCVAKSPALTRSPQLPVAGSAYNYVAVTFGELPAFLVGCDLVLEYTISAAAVARGWTSYAATLVGLPSNAFRLGRGLVQLDVLALLNVFAQSGILCVGMRESSNFNVRSACSASSSAHFLNPSADCREHCEPVLHRLCAAGRLGRGGHC
jgi:APA family basic amino acid/polyamine antiporter